MCRINLVRRIEGSDAQYIGSVVGSGPDKFRMIWKRRFPRVMPYGLMMHTIMENCLLPCRREAEDADEVWGRMKVVNVVDNM